MRNLFGFIFGIGLLLGATLGCGIVDRITGDSTSAESNKTIEDKAIDAAVGDAKIGIAECDEVVVILNEQINDPNDNFVTKAVKRTMLNQFRDQLKRQLEQNQTDKKAVGEFCAEFKKNLVEGNEANSNKAKN